jgi:hypothetical protein
MMLTEAQYSIKLFKKIGGTNMDEKESPLLQKYKGQLRIFITTPSGVVFDEVKGFKYDDKETTLFDYVGSAAASIFTNLTTRLSIKTSPEFWEIEEFSPDKGILRVKQVGGEPLEYEDDDQEKLAAIHGFTTNEAAEFLEDVFADALLVDALSKLLADDFIRNRKLLTKIPYQLFDEQIVTLTIGKGSIICVKDEATDILKEAFNNFLIDHRISECVEEMLDQGDHFIVKFMTVH